MSRPSVEISGNLLSEAILDSLAEEGSRHPFAKPESFRWYKYDVIDSQSIHLSRIAEAYEKLKARWDMQSSSFNDLDISALRDKWIRYLFTQLGYNLEYQKADVAADSGNKFCLSHRGWVGESAPVVHTVLFNQDLDRKPDDGRHKHSPHDTLQRYLNQSKTDTWGIVTNGRELRTLRDFHHETRQAYVKFDLELIFEGRNYTDFRLLWRLIHPSRFIANEEGKCILDNLFDESKNAGVAIGENLQKNIRLAIESLANGFLLSTPELIDNTIDNNEESMHFYQQILRVIYRVLFLFYSEQRKLMPTHSALYAREYSLSSLRQKIELQEFIDPHHTDLWEGLKVTFQMVYQGVPELEIPAFNGQLFNPHTIEQLDKSKCRNDKLLEAIQHMSVFEKEGLMHRISYIELDVDEIGSIYESLLEYIPSISSKEEVFEDAVLGIRRNRERCIPPRTFFLDPRGTNRKTSGSYYTNPGLVNALIESALVPVLEEKLKIAGPNKDAQEKALLSIKVCDPACGSAAFLIAATDYLGEKLAKIRIQGEYPSDADIRYARREVLRYCIYGVDLNPMAVELAKVSLWLTAATSDLPLNFLDHRIKCGNSLIGTTPELMKKGIPAEAYSAVEGDNKDLAKRRMKLAKEYLKDKDRGQFRFRYAEREEIEKEYLIKDISEVYGENTPGESKEIEKVYRKNREREEFLKNKFIADYWCSAFFWKHDDETEDYPSPEVLEHLLEDEKLEISKLLKEKVNQIAKDYKFFHWHLEFPNVFANGGFDCVLGNPPWEKNKPNDKEFFAAYSSDGFTMTKSARDKAKLKKELLRDKSIFKIYKEYKVSFEFYKKFFKSSSMYLIQGTGDVNLYKLFFELDNCLAKKKGVLGIILPGGILGSAGTKEIRSYLFKQASHLKIIRFNQWANVFHGVAHKISLMSFQKYTGNGQFEMAPELMSIEEINCKKFVTIPTKLVEKISPNLLSLPNIENDIEISILEKLHKYPVLVENFKINREIDMSLDAKHFTSSVSGLPIWDGRQIFCLKNVSDPKEYIDKEFFYNRFKYDNEVKFKTVIRNIIPDSAKKVYSSLLPKESATSFALRCLIYTSPKDNTYDNHLYLASLLSSYIIEWRILKLVSDINLATFLPDVPVALQIDKKIKEAIVKQAKIIYENDLDNEMRLVGFSEINALVAIVYDIRYEELDYVMNSFKILKKNDIGKYREYRTRRLVLERHEELKLMFK